MFYGVSGAKHEELYWKNLEVIDNDDSLEE